MNVCFDISAALTQGAGVSRYIRELLGAMLSLEDGPNVTLFNNRRPNQTLDTLPSLAQSLSRVEAPYSDKHWRMRLISNATPPQVAALQRNMDVFHATDVVTPSMSVPVVTTVHDMTTWLFPQFHTRANRWYQRLMLPVFMRRATQIIADSHSTKSDLMRLTGVPDKKIQVIHLGVDHSRFHPRNLPQARHNIAAKLNIVDPYFLAVGTLEPRKNLTSLLQAFTQSGLSKEGYKLVLTGMKGWNIEPLFKTLHLNSEMSHAVVLTGLVSDELLLDLYSAATAFVYPSIHEGFGLPVLEAMACGAPVITSNTSSLPEVAGDAALLVSPTDVEAIARAMQLLASDSAESARYRSLSINQATQFNWRNTALGTLEIYNQASASEGIKPTGKT